MENPIKMDDLGVPLFLETPMYFLLKTGFCQCHASFQGWIFILSTRVSRVIPKFHLHYRLSGRDGDPLNMFPRSMQQIRTFFGAFCYMVFA